MAEEDKYQVTLKAKYINLLLLEDELKHFDSILIKAVSDSDSWLNKLRATRGIFLTLNNVKDFIDSNHIRGNKEFISNTRTQRKNLNFAKHFRNKGIGHLDSTLLKRAVQWHPQIFDEKAKDNELFKVAESQISIIESCINSFVDDKGKQKIFDTEIDLNYPPDYETFFSYLYKLVQETNNWILLAKNIMLKDIKFYTEKEFLEINAVAGLTNFNLKEESDLEFIKNDVDSKLQEALKSLKGLGAEPEVLNMIKNIFKSAKNT